MDVYSPAAKQVIAFNHSFTITTDLSVAPPLASCPFLPRITISANNYWGIPPRSREAVMIAVHAI